MGHPVIFPRSATVVSNVYIHFSKANNKCQQECTLRRQQNLLANKAYLVSIENKLSNFILIFASLIQTLIIHFSELAVSGLFALHRQLF